MNFYSYMVRNYKGSGSEEKDLANVMRKDRERFPRNSCHKLAAWGELIRKYVHSHEELYHSHLLAFERCWKEYVTCEKDRLSKSS